MQQYFVTFLLGVSVQNLEIFQDIEIFEAILPIEPKLFFLFQNHPFQPFLV